MPTDPTFTVERATDRQPGSTLVVGLPLPGMASLTAADYLAGRDRAAYAGHVDSTGIPTIAPFENGSPRHHTRLFDLPAADLTVVASELFVPVTAAAAFVDGLLELLEQAESGEIVLLHGIPYSHGPDEHAVFSVATEGYRSRRLADSEISPLRGGVLDGVAGEVLARGLDDPALEVAAFVTPSHLPGPDVDGAIRLLEAIDAVYGVAVDPGELAEVKDRWQRYYAELADRLTDLAGTDDSRGAAGYPVDRGYM